MFIKLKLFKKIIVNKRKCLPKMFSDNSWKVGENKFSDFTRKI